jgi:hypothetical protein
MKNQDLHFPIDPLPDLKLALGLIVRNINNRHEAFDAALGLVMSRLPHLIDEAEEARQRAKESKGYAVVIHDPDHDPVIETQGPVEVFHVDLGGSYDIASPEEEDALSALQDAADYTRAAEGLPQGVVKDTLEGAAGQIMEAYSEFIEHAAEGLDAEDKATLAAWIPQAEVEGVA